MLQLITLIIGIAVIAIVEYYSGYSINKKESKDEIAP